MSNSVLKENILRQTIGYKNYVQNDTVKRYIFKENKGEDDNPLLYNLLTKDISSYFFKRKINNYTKISLLKASEFNINVSEMVKLFMKNGTNKNHIKNGHYPFDIKFSILDFHKITNKFINVYQILGDGSLNKLNPTTTYRYNGQQVGMTVTMNGINTVNIEFYDNGKANSYMIEIMNCVNNYDCINFQTFEKDYRDKDDIIYFANGTIVHSDYISRDDIIEVYKLKDGFIRYNGLVPLKNNKINLLGDAGIISDKLVFPYSYKDELGNIVNKQFPNMVSNTYKYVPNVFTVNSINSWYKTEVDNYSKINEISDSIYISMNTYDMWSYISGKWSKYKPINQNIFFKPTKSDDFFRSISGGIEKVEVNVSTIKKVEQDIYYFNNTNNKFYKFDGSTWSTVIPNSDDCFIDENNTIILYGTDEVQYSTCYSSNTYIYNEDLWHMKNDKMIKDAFTKITTSNILIRISDDNINCWEKIDGVMHSKNIIRINTSNDLENIDDHESYYLTEDNKLYIQYNDSFVNRKYKLLEDDTILLSTQSDKLYSYSYKNDEWSIIDIAINEYYMDSDTEKVVYTYDGFKWFNYVPICLRDNIVHYDTVDNIYWRYYDSEWSIVNMNKCHIIYKSNLYNYGPYMWNYKNDTWSIIDINKIYMDKNTNIVYYYNEGDKLCSTTLIEPITISSDIIYYDKENNLHWKHLDDNNIHILILGDTDTYLKSDYTMMYSELLGMYNYNAKVVDEILTSVLNGKTIDERMVLECPYYYKENIEKKIKDKLYIKTIDKIRKTQIDHLNGKAYVKFTFPIKSFSFMLFMNGKIVKPDLYEEDELDIRIYILASKILNVSDIYENDEFDDKIMSMYTHKRLSKNRHKDMEDYLYDSKQNITLKTPITVIRSKSFFNSNNRYLLTSSPVYIKKSLYDRYEYNYKSKTYTKKMNGRYVKYNSRYYMISNYEYNYDKENNTFVRCDNDGDYYKIINNRMKIPYNKHLEEDIHNLIFVKEFNKNYSKIMDNVTVDIVKANSKYPDVSNISTTPENSVLNVNANHLLDVDLGEYNSLYGDTLDDSKFINSKYDQMIYDAKSILNKSDIPNMLINSIINILIDNTNIYFITNLSCIEKTDENILCKAISYNIDSSEYEIQDNVPLNGYLYIENDLYGEEDNLILSHTDERVLLDGGFASNEYEAIIGNASIDDSIEYDNIIITEYFIYFFNNINCTNNGNINISTYYSYDRLNKIITEESNININYDEIYYLHENIYDNDMIIFRRKGYPRTNSDNKTITLYNGNIGYSKYYNETHLSEFDIPEQILYNLDQLMLFNDGYLYKDFTIDEKLKIFNTIGSDIFISNMPYLKKYQSIEDMKLYSNMTIELAENFDDKVLDKSNYRKLGRNCIDIVHIPMSLKYMAIFVNGLYMDENHVDILSDRRFMLKNLKDYPDRFNKDINGNYMIDTIDVYSIPISLDERYLYYYKDKITHRDEYGNKKYDEYPIIDKLYNNYLSEVVSSSKVYCDKIIFNEKYKDNFYEYALSDFRHIGLDKFTHDELSKFANGRFDESKVMNKYTHNELSEYMHIELSNFIHDKEEE